MLALQRHLHASHAGKFISPDIFFCNDEASCEAKGKDYCKRIGVPAANEPWQRETFRQLNAFAKATPPP